MRRALNVLLAGAALACGAALAQSATPGSSAATLGAGSAEASPSGASAGGMTAGEAASRGDERRADKARKHDRHGSRTSPTEANSASTYGSGAVNTTRDSASAGVTTGGQASGSGSQSAGSTVDAYGDTTRQGSSADIYGDSAAQSGAPRQ